jgi:tetratricopeptide (TPR) repeat protein
MKTLYDLLGALPEDDAESIRAAFRKAAKANHPDRNPGDPDAPRRFRRIVRANDILSDEHQRAAYDRLLDIALAQEGLKSNRGIFSKKARSAAVDAMTGFALTVGILAAAYLLLVPDPMGSLVPAHVADVSTPAPAPTALILSTRPSDVAERASPHEKPDEIAAPEKREIPAPSEKHATPGPPSGDAVGAASSPDIPPEPNSGTGDAKYYHERGISAYRSGDLYLALVDFDLAISLDPRTSDTYIDRAIVYHRIGDLKHAFADVSKAKRIDDPKRRKASPATASAP